AQLATGEGTRGVDLEAQVDRLARTDTGEQGTRQAAPAWRPDQVLTIEGGLRAGIPVHRICADLSRTEDVGEAHRQRLGEGGGVDAKQA
ncbi:MAG: hypothetical protein NZ572_08055, partial [Thermoflexus sp.]|nr:hypothetical protein [Thermoflexus sp.]